MNFIKINVKVYLVIIKLKSTNVGLLECWDQKWVTLGAVIFCLFNKYLLGACSTPIVF